MSRHIFAITLFAVASAALGAQEASQNSPYQGTSNPPSDDTILVTTTPQAKPPAGKPLNAAPGATAPAVTAQGDPDAATAPNVAPAPAAAPPAAAVLAPAPVLSARGAAPDPDGDIVHPAPLGPGQLGEGTNIRVKLLDRLSTYESEKGQPFRSQVAADVYQGDLVLIPAGSEIDGRVVDVSSGHLGGHGSMRLRPETVILANGTRFELHGEVTGTPGSRTRVGSEGTIIPGSRVKRDSLEYGGAVGTGVVVGAVIAGPVGAVTGGAIGAGAETAHLLINHPQATLQPGAILQFTLTDTLSLTAVVTPGN